MYCLDLPFWSVAQETAWCTNTYVVQKSSLIPETLNPNLHSSEICSDFKHVKFFLSLGLANCPIESWSNSQKVCGLGKAQICAFLNTYGGHGGCHRGCKSHCIFSNVAGYSAAVEGAATVGLESCLALLHPRAFSPHFSFFTAVLVFCLVYLSIHFALCLLCAIFFLPPSFLE